MLFKYEHHLRILLIILWAGFVTGAYFISEGFKAALLIRFFIYLFVDPAVLLTGSFWVAKTFGSRWYYTAAIIITSVLLYIFTPLKNIVPNLIAVTAICTVFGGGIGNIFTTREKQEKKISESYTPILGDEKKQNKKKAEK